MSSGGGVLDDILKAKREEVEATSRVMSPDPRRAVLKTRTVAKNLVRAPGEPLRLITEIKRRSPSAGVLSTTLSVADRALAYAAGGASMISVLCDERFFGGGFHHVVEAREALDAAGYTTPILAKEFIIDERQLEQAAIAGAEAVLLIVRIVDASKLAELVQTSLFLGLEPLVEVVTEDELRVALDAKAEVIGVNARDLDTLVMNKERAAHVLAKIPDSCVAAHFSGLKTAADVREVAAASGTAPAKKIDAALIGEALMREDNPSALLADMLRAASTD